MSVTVPNVGALKTFLTNLVNNCLENDVAPEVQIILAENAQVDVYDAYNPHYYNRSYSLTEGAPSTYDIEAGDLDVAINVNHPYGKLIEYGNGVDGMYYEYPFNNDDTAEQFLNPRPFFRHTKEQLSDGKYKELLKSALEKWGVNVS